MNTLTDITMASLQASFIARNNHPSQEHLAALRAVAQNMEDMANGTAMPCVYLAALDPGIGKTQTTIHFIRALAASKAHSRVGIVVCLGRTSQIMAVAKDLDLPPGKLAILTSKPAVNALSPTPVDHAQVLLTTQQMVERRTQKGSFAAARAFHFQGSPRAVRVWDEAIEWASPISLGWSEIDALVHTAMAYSPALADALHAFAGRVKGMTQGDEVLVPDFQQDHGVSWRDIEAGLAGASGPVGEVLRSSARDLRVLNGRRAGVFVENRGRGTILSYHQRLPEDLRPILVLDASIRVRQTYKDMLGHRQGFVQVAQAVKDYEDLTVHVWNTPGSKDAFSKGGAGIVEGVASAIETKPTERWLVVTHKQGRLVGDIKAKVLAQLPDTTKPNVAFLTFGEHLATNNFSEFPNVILAGQFFAPISHYAALTHASKDRPTTDGLVSQAEVEATRRGELADVTLQAIARGRCRKSIGSKAAPMDAYIIATNQSGIPALLPTIFPGCQVKAWTPFKKALRGDVKKAVEQVQRALEGGMTTIPLMDISEALGIDRSNFGKRVAGKEEWSEAIHKMGCRIGRGPRGVLQVQVGLR